MPNKPEDVEMSDRDRALAEYFAQHTTARMIDAIKDPALAEQIATTWADAGYRVIGKAVFRLLLYIVGVSLLVASIKTGLVDKFLAGFK